MFTSCHGARRHFHMRLGGIALFKIVRRLGERCGIKVWPHGIRHTSITTAMEKAKGLGYDVEEVTDFSRHSDARTMLVYRDRVKNAQGKLAEAVAGEVDG